MLHQSIKAKLLLSMGILVISIVSFGLVYFPERLREQVYDSFDHELEILCSTLALGIGVGLEHEDFGSIQKALDFTKTDDTVLMIGVLDLDKQIIAAYPEDTSFDDFSAQSDGLTRASGFVTFCSPCYAG